MVALKKVRVPLSEEGVPMSTLREISLLKQMEKYEHPNIVRYQRPFFHTHLPFDLDTTSMLLQCYFNATKMLLGCYSDASRIECGAV